MLSPGKSARSAQLQALRLCWTWRSTSLSQTHTWYVAWLVSIVELHGVTAENRCMHAFLCVFERGFLITGPVSVCLSELVRWQSATNVRTHCTSWA